MNNFLPNLRLLQLREYPIYEQLQIEEALLRASHENWCLINWGSPPAIVMGISGKLEELIDEKKLQQCPIPVIRRFSGGGTVVVDHQTLFVTFICNAEKTVSCCPQKVLHWTADFYKSVFPTGFQLQENDYAMGDRKFGGNAQYFRKERWLHHSSLLWDYQPFHMEYLLHPMKTPKYREGRNHLDFLCKLQDHLDKQEFEEAFTATLNKYFTVEHAKTEHVTEILALPHRKACQLLSKTTN